MRKITIEFEETEESLIDESALLCAIQGQNLAGIIWNFDQELRKIYKYSEDGKEVEIVENLREKLHDMLFEEGISLEKLYY